MYVMYLCAMSQLFRLLCCMMSVAAILAPCHIMFLRVLSRATAAFLALPCSALLSRLGWIGCVACHVMTLCVDRGSSATPQLELDYTCSSRRSLCVLLARHVLACVARHVTTCGHVLELNSSGCHCLPVMSCSGVSDM